MLTFLLAAQWLATSQPCHVLLPRLSRGRRGLWGAGRRAATAAAFGPAVRPGVQGAMAAVGGDNLHRAPACSRVVGWFSATTRPERQAVPAPRRHYRRGLRTRPSG